MPSFTNCDLFIALAVTSCLAKRCNKSTTGVPARFEDKELASLLPFCFVRKALSGIRWTAEVHSSVLWNHLCLKSSVFLSAVCTSSIITNSPIEVPCGISRKPSSGHGGSTSQETLPEEEKERQIEVLNTKATASL